MRFALLLSLGASVLAGPLLPRFSNSTNTNKPVFAHYMIGQINDDHCRQDIVDAKALGLDAFALNINTLQSWATDTVDSLFTHAAELDFKLFFSFDMNPGYFGAPSDFSGYLKPFLSNSAYFNYNGKPLVSTFAGESVSNDEWNSLRTSAGDMLIVPGFSDATPSADFFTSKYTGLDGVFNWNSWPQTTDGAVEVYTTQDTEFQSAAKSASKLFMMGVSPLQFKHLSGFNWYRRGPQNFEYRLDQVLQVQPDMLELQTWNDGGESHYMGNLWPEPMSTSTIPTYTNGYDHKGYWEVLKSFIDAWKRGDTDTSGMVPTNGADVQGVFWHHTLLVDGDCSPDALGKPSNYMNASNNVTGIVLVAEGKTGLSVTVTSGSTQLGTQVLNPGFNRFSFGEQTVGGVSVTVSDGSNSVKSGTGSIQVTDSATICNYNYQVVALS